MVPASWAIASRPSPKPPPRVVEMARGGLRIDGGGRGAKVYRAERTPTGGWVIYFEAKPSDPFLIYPPPTHGLGDSEKPGEPKPIPYRYGRVIVRRHGDVGKVSLIGEKDGFRPLNFGFERTPES